MLESNLSFNDATAVWTVASGAFTFPVAPDSLPVGAKAGDSVFFEPKYHARGPVVCDTVRVAVSLASSAPKTVVPRGMDLDDLIAELDVREARALAGSGASSVIAKWNVGAPPFIPRGERGDALSTPAAGAQPHAHAAVRRTPTPQQARLCEQVEFYLKPSNLRTDAFMQSKMDRATGAVPLQVILTCNKIKIVTTSMTVLMDALAMSPALEVDRVRASVRFASGAPPALDAAVADAWDVKAKALDDRMKQQHAAYLEQRQQNHREAQQRRSRRSYGSDDHDDQPRGEVFHDDNGHACYGSYVQGRGYVAW